MSIAQLALAIEESFADLGIHVNAEETENEVVVALHIPRHLKAAVSGVDVIAQRELVPSDAVGAMVGAKHKLRKKLKKVAKKIAHSKVLRKLGSLAIDAAPGGKQLKATLKATKALKRALKKGKGKHPAAQAEAHADAADAHEELQADLAQAGPATGDSDSPESEDSAPQSDDMSQLAEAPAEDDSAADDTASDDDAGDDSASDDTSSDYTPE